MGTTHFMGLSILALLLPAILASGCGAPASPPDRLVEGQPFPPVMLRGLDGGTAPLAAYRGRLVVLNVWATWCAPCRKELPSLQRLSRSVDPQRVVVMGLTLDDDVHVVREYLIDKGITFPNFIDQGMRIANDTFGLRVYPGTFFIGTDGKLLGRVIGERTWDTPEVIHALEEAYQGRGFDLSGK